MIHHYSLPHARQQAVFNLIGYVVIIAVNAMANTVYINGHNTGEISDMYPNLFTPAGFTFSIWSVIYLGLLACMVYQLWLAFSPHHNDELQSFMMRMRSWFLLNCIGNTGWIFAWHYRVIPLSLLLMLVVLYSLLKIHRNFRIAMPVTNKREFWFVQVPFSIYLGWISIATLANITVLLVAMGFECTGMAPAIWAIAMILIGTAAAIMMIIYRNNFIHALVAIWAIYGIMMKRYPEKDGGSFAIFAVCVICVLILFLAIIIRFNAKKNQPNNISDKI
ncbi:hypothetical protein LX64_01874 [Chitinophaga skermanii]|uniref:TspO/MBR related protein n=1 Tax=Chitinophaga skermanii TaxID=331697 RepID=A0A327QYK6_9BACT|nr:hypothetical protein [Chitinophaga skermanii]RAJ06747.1 hypothetical protein LX64_01874 [Chitinophaga skermanii]